MELLIGRKGSIGAIQFSEGSCWPIDTTYYIDKTMTNEDLRWLAFWLGNLHLAQLNKAAAVPGLNRNDAYEVWLPLPPIEEQRRIVAVLGEKLAAVERARLAAQAQLEAAQALPAATLRAIFDSPEAQSWPRYRLGDVLIQRREIIHPRNNPQGKATFVGLEHIESGTGVRIGSLPVQMEELTGRKPKYYKDDIVYGYLRPYLNKVWIAEFDGLCSVDQYVYSVNLELADVEFVAWFMRSSTYLKRAPIGLTPGQLPRIRTDEVAAVEINLPSLDKQRQIMDKLKHQMATVKHLASTLETQSSDIEAMPASFLRQAFNGEL